MNVVVKRLQQDFRSPEPTYTDLWVCCDGVTFAVHRVVAEAHSEFFRAPRQKFATQGTSVQQPLVLEGFPGGPRCFKNILNYCYSDDGVVNDDIVPVGDLLGCVQAADWLLMPELLHKLQAKIDMLDTQGRMEVIAALAEMEDLQMSDEIGATFSSLLERFCLVDLARIPTQELHALLRKFSGRMHQLITLVLQLLVQRTDQATTVVGIRQLLLQVYKFHAAEFGSSQCTAKMIRQEPDYVRAVLDELATLEPGVLFSRYSVNFTPHALFCKYVPVFVEGCGGTNSEGAEDSSSGSCKIVQQKAMRLLCRQPDVVAHSPDLLQQINRVCNSNDACSFYADCLVSCRTEDEFNLLKEAVFEHFQIMSDVDGTSRSDAALGLLKIIAHAQPEEQSRVLTVAAGFNSKAAVQALLEEYWRYLFQVDLQLLVRMCKVEGDSRTRRLFLDAIQLNAASLQSLQNFLSDHTTFTASDIRPYLANHGVYYSPVIQFEACNDVGFTLRLRVVLDCRRTNSISESCTSADTATAALERYPQAFVDQGTNIGPEGIGLYAVICTDALSPDERDQIKNHIVRITALKRSLLLDPDEPTCRHYMLQLSGNSKSSRTPRAPNPLNREMIGAPSFFSLAELTEAVSGTDGKLAIAVKVSAATRRLFSVLSEKGRRRYDTTGEVSVHGFRERFQSQGCIQTPALPAFTPTCDCQQTNNTTFSFTVEFRESATQYRDLDLHIRFLSPGEILGADPLPRDRNYQFLLDHKFVLLGFHAAYNVWKVLLTLDTDVDTDYCSALAILLTQDSTIRRWSILWRRDLRNWLVGGEDLKLRVEFRCKHLMLNASHF